MSEEKRNAFQKWLTDDLGPIFMLGIKSALVLFLFYLGDVLYQFWNPHFPSVALFNWNLSFFALIAVLLLLENRILRNLGLGLLSLAALLSYFHFQYFGTYVQPTSFLLIEGNLNEIFLSLSHALDTMLVPFLIVVATYILMIPVSNADFFKIKSLRSTQSNLIGIVLFLGLAGLGFLVTHLQLRSTTGQLATGHAERLLPKSELHSVENFYRSFSYLVVGIIPRKMRKPKNTFRPIPPPLKELDDPDVNVVLIIGESMRAKSLSLLGYKKNNTSPELNAISKDLLYASTVYTSGTMTKTSLPSLLNRTPFPGMTEQMFLQKNCLFNLAKQSGFTTHFYSAQMEDDIGMLRNYFCERYVDHYESKTSYESKKKNAQKRDAILQDMLGEVDFKKGPQFIVLHQRGSHTPYALAYPPEYKRFESDYDNSIAYTSFILDSLFKQIRAQTHKKTYIIYTSDHGELLGEHNMQGHGWFYPEVYQVPFLFYVINDELSNFPLSKVRTHFGVSNLIAKLLGFQVSIEKPDKIYVNGSEVSGLDGYLRIDLDEAGNPISQKRFR